MVDLLLVIKANLGKIFLAPSTDLDPDEVAENENGNEEGESMMEEETIF
jgi:hypothetical protein